MSTKSNSSRVISGKSKSIVILDKVQVGDVVYVPENASDEPWRRAEVEEISQYYGRGLLKVNFCTDENGKKLTTRGIKITKRLVSLEHVAYLDEKPHILQPICVGIRVIAQIPLNSFSSTLIFFSGIVAEPPAKNRNGERYLIFFDNGRADYVQSENVRLIATHGPHSWSCLHPNVQQFVHEYVQKYPDVHKATIRKFFIVAVEWNGHWWPGRVVDIDCSLAQIELLDNSLRFWIHKGSPRLLSNYKATLQQKNISEVSTSYCGEYEGKVQTLVVPAKYSKLGNQLRGNGHLCDAACSPSFPGSAEELSNLSPFAIPFFHGWKREMFPLDPTETDKPQCVYYVTPCSKKLLNYNEILEFINDTSTEFLEIDNFTFDPEVDCLAEFQVKAKPFRVEEDISNGQEKMKIERINTVDDSAPRDFLYNPVNVVDPEVPLSADSGFLVCCDCPDNCRDKRSCACFRLCAENEPELETKYGKNMRHFGYEYRRLTNPHVSGIYECNEMCTCKNTCINRVVQNGIKFRLQVFKTTRNGYALRTIHDIPQGSFICTYSGLLLPNSQANIFVSNAGDYFTNLDLIETYETYKPDYEPIAIEPEEEIPVQQRGKKSKRGKSRKANNNSQVMKTLDSFSRSGNSTSNQQKSQGGKSNGTGINKENSYSDANKINQRQLLFGIDEEVFVIDSKNVGNVGRFMNHSCAPNVSGQNVFTTSHDLRFPNVGFFATTFIKAGSELTWNYNYQVGSVPGKVVSCNCGSVQCKKRLF